jgi:DNA (cytosine-5)-methyltransferase 1
VGLDEPVRTITTKDQWAIVDGDLYRPFTVRETARAMGFPDDYGWPERATRGDLIRGLGNAVCPPVAHALIEAVAA